MKEILGTIAFFFQIKAEFLSLAEHTDLYFAIGSLQQTYML